MKYTLLYYQNRLYAAISDGLVNQFDPPEVYYCIEIKSNIIKDILSTHLVYIVPKHLCVEITDINKINIIKVLYN
jgi:histidinol phosphatase-like PHP family hydrolase